MSNNNEVNDGKKKYVKTPWPIFIFQWGFLAFLCILAVIEPETGPFGLPWNTFIINWVSFVVLIVTAFGYIYFRNRGEI